MSEPVRREVIVNAGPPRAFTLFTDRIGAWWPLDTHSVFGDGTVAFEADVLVERSGERESVWGEVRRWDAPHGLALTWHPGYGSQHATEIEVAFTPVADQTLVTLVHGGWERMTDPDASAAEYGAGWPGVLARYRELLDEVGA